MDNKLCKKADELIFLLDNNTQAVELNNWWSNNKIWFELATSAENKKEIETSFMLYTNTNEPNIKTDLITTLKETTNSTYLTLGNVF